MKRRIQYRVSLILSILIMFGMIASSPGIPNINGILDRIYVDTDASGANNGDSWTDAYEYLQDALDEAKSSSSTYIEIWVAEGTYYPDEDNIGTDHVNNSQSESFTIEYDNIRLFGGFAGNETSLIQRLWSDHPTILSGDIDQNDSNSDGNNIAEDWSDISGNNAYHVILLDGTTNEDLTIATVIDGFWITAGNAAPISGHGGGIYCFSDGATAQCDPELRNIIVQGNKAFFGGGIGLYANNGGISSPTITNLLITGNRADEDGGGFDCWLANSSSGICSPTLVNVKFNQNSSGDDGGGMLVFANQGTVSPSLTNVEFFNNVAAGDGGGLSISAGNAASLSAVLTNISISGNQAYRGGGIKTYKTLDSTFNMTIVNTIVWGNTALDARPEIYNYGTSPDVYYSDIEGCGGSSAWDSQCGTDNGNNIDIDPQFVDELGGDLRLRINSPLIDVGDQSALPLDVTDLDQDGNFAETLPDDLFMSSRVAGFEVDMGVFEYNQLIMDNVGFYVPSKYRWYFKTDMVDGWSGVISMGWGGASELQPVIGDWDGDGVDTAGFYKPSQYKWLIKNNQIDGWSGVTNFNWGGSAVMTPIAGDWDGDGDDTVGFYKEATGEWFLKDENTAGWSGFTKVVWGGAAGNIPIVGDWNGDGSDTIGYFVPSQNKWWLKSNLVDGWGGVSGFSFGSADPMEPVTGDWDGDGIDTVGGYTAAKWRWYLKDDQVSGWSNVSILKFAPAAAYEVLAGDWE